MNLMTTTSRPAADPQTTLFAPSLPPQREMERAFLSSDATYDGIFFTGVRTTGIFCRPSCRARKPRSEERRVGKECRSRGSADREKKKVKRAQTTKTDSR